MTQPIFDDITPRRNGSSNDQSSHSIRSVSPLDTKERASRRQRRATRRQVPSQPRTQRTGSSAAIWIIAVLIFIISISTVGLVYIGKTTLVVTPLQKSFTLTPNVVYTAYRNAGAGELEFGVLSDSINTSSTLSVSGSTSVREKSTGRITIYNTYSSAPLRLIKNTRFASPSGNIYRIRNSIIVPGKRSTGKAGSIEATVYADVEGADQNIKDLQTRFTIPGLKGDPRYDAFYATLKTPLAGGFVGNRPIVDDTQLNAARATLREKLQSQVQDAITAKLPKGKLLFKKGIFVTFESSPVIYTDAKTATVREVAHIQAVTFDALSFAHVLAITTLAAPKSGDILIDTPSALTLTIVNRAGVDIISDSLLQFTLKGATTLTWQVDTNALRRDLVGKPRIALNTVMKGYPGIKRAQSTIRPFWKKTFPSDTSRITVEIKTGK